jgi:hypothetical protein
MHSLRPLRERAIKRSIPAKAEPELASLEMPSTFSTLGLARIGRVADTSSTKIAGEAIEQPRHTPLAMRAMQPRPQTVTQMATRPRDANLLRDAGFARHFQFEQVLISPHCSDIGPTKRRPGPSGVAEKPKPAKNSDVQAVAAKFLNRGFERPFAPNLALIPLIKEWTPEIPCHFCFSVKITPLASRCSFPALIVRNIEHKPGIALNHR